MPNGCNAVAFEISPTNLCAPLYKERGSREKRDSVPSAFVARADTFQCLMTSVFNGVLGRFSGSVRSAESIKFIPECSISRAIFVIFEDITFHSFILVPFSIS